MAKTRLRQSIFGILLTVFLLVVLPIYLAGFLVYDWGIRQVKSEISRSIEAKNRSVIEAMDSSFRATRNHLSSMSWAVSQSCRNSGTAHSTRRQRRRKARSAWQTARSPFTWLIPSKFWRAAVRPPTCWRSPSPVR